MPLVQRSARTVQTDALPGVRKSAAETPTSTGAGLAEAQGQTARAVGRLGETVTAIGTQRIAEHEAIARQQADELVQVAYSRQFDQFEQARLHDPQTGVFSTVKGQAALGLTETVVPEFDELSDRRQCLSLVHVPC